MQPVPIPSLIYDLLLLLGVGLLGGCLLWLLRLQICEKRAVRHEREVTIDFLRRVNESPNLHSLLDMTIQFFHEQSGCRAIGIRLKLGADYPFHATRGFAEEFLQEENSLCERARNNAVSCDAEGRPLITCLCGRVIRGELAPKTPFVTPYGSFCTSRVSEVAGRPDSTGEPFFCPRKKCLQEPYDSLALIPLYLGNNRFGLIHLADRAPGKFKPDQFGLLERLADHMAVAVAKFMADKALQKSEQRYRSLFTNMSSGLAYCRMIFERDLPADFVYLEVNDAFGKLTGLKNVIGRKASELIPGLREERPDLFEVYGRVARTGKPERLTLEIKPLALWLEMTVYSMDFGCFVTVFDNITERKKMEQRSLQDNRMEAVGKLAGGVAHDFNNILQSILGFTELLMDDIPASDPRRENLNEIILGAKRASDLTSQLLAGSRRQLLAPVTLDLNASVQGAGRMLQRLLGENIELVTRLTPGLPPVMADPGQLEQVIINLAVNARDAMPLLGGRLIIGTKERRVSGKDIPVMPDSRPGNFVCLTVTDNGAGMSPEVMSRIFEPFFSTRGLGKGTGLGLSIIHGIVHQHQGWISVDSEEARGSTFRVYLPASADEAALDHPDSLPGEDVTPQGNGEHILLVEDDPAIRTMSARILSTAGYSIDAVENSEAALTLFDREHGRFHLLFSDVTLTDRNGIELADLLQAKQTDIAVLLCSGYSDSRSHRSVIEGRKIPFLQKPYPAAALLRAVRETLDREKN